MVDLYLSLSQIILNKVYSINSLIFNDKKNLYMEREKIFKLFQEKKYTKISKLSKSIIKNFINDKEVHKIVIFSELNEKNFHKAYLVSRRLLDTIDDSETNYIHGNILKLQNKFKDAILFYEKAIKLNKNYFEAYNNLATSQKKIGLTNDAFHNYKNAIKIKENNLEANYNLGNLLYDEKRFDEAVKYFENVILKLIKIFLSRIYKNGLINSVRGKFDIAKDFFKSY